VTEVSNAPIWPVTRKGFDLANTLTQIDAVPPRQLDNHIFPAKLL